MIDGQGLLKVIDALGKTLELLEQENERLKTELAAVKETHGKTDSSAA